VVGLAAGGRAQPVPDGGRVPEVLEVVVLAVAAVVDVDVDVRRRTGRIDRADRGWGSGWYRPCRSNDHRTTFWIPPPAIPPNSGVPMSAFMSASTYTSGSVMVAASRPIPLMITAARYLAANCRVGTSTESPPVD